MPSNYWGTGNYQSVQNKSPKLYVIISAAALIAVGFMIYGNVKNNDNDNNNNQTIYNEQLNHAKEVDYIPFGAYEQDNDRSNGEELV